MIYKGKPRSNGAQLGRYLGNYLQSEKNERVEVLEITGSSFRDLTRAIAGWEGEAQRTKCKKPIWFAALSPTHQEFLSREQQIEAANILSRHLGLDGQPRAVVIHKKRDGSEHIHIAWSRIDRQTGKAIRDTASHRKGVAAAREIEKRFGLERVPDPEFKNSDKSKSRRERREESKKSISYRESQVATRSGLDPTQRKETMTRVYHSSDSGQAFRTALQDAGYILAMGNRRDYVVVDKAGDIHSVARQVKGAYAADIRERMKGVDPASIPKARHIQQQLRHAHAERGPYQAKEDAGPDPPKPDWRERLKVAATSPIEQSTRRQSSPFDKEPERDPLDPSAILSALTERMSTFTKADMEYVVAGRLEASKVGSSERQVNALCAKIRALPEFIPLGKDRVERPRFTSRAILETELEMRRASDKLATRSKHAVQEGIREHAPSAEKLGIEQKAAFEHVTGDKDLALVVGHAGTGKSTMLGAAREAWEAQGYRVRGAALSSMAAKSLQDGSEIKCQTLASTLYGLDTVDQQQDRIRELEAQREEIKGRSNNDKLRRFNLTTQIDRRKAQLDATILTDRDIVVLDEAAMVGSVDMNRLLQAAKDAKAKVVLVGDAEQLQAIDAGGAFRALSERHGCVAITEIRRQKEDWQKQATKDFAQSFTPEAIEAYNERGKVIETSTSDEARSQMVAAWTECRKTEPEKTQIMMAFTRADVAELNISARTAYRAEGRLNGQDVKIETDAGKKDFAAGDRLYFLQNDFFLGVRNGSLGTLKAVKAVYKNGESSHRLTVKLDTGEQLDFDTADYNKISHGYASTVSKAQGATVDRAYLLASRYMDRHSAYVGMSRHREDASLFFASDEFGNYERMTDALSRDRRKDTTLDYLARAEAENKKEAFLARILKHMLPKADDHMEHTFMERLRAEREMTPDQRRARFEAEDERKREEKLFRILLSDERERKRDRTYSHSM